MSWFPGGRSRSSSDVNANGKPRADGAWILGSESRVDYNTALLVNGEKVFTADWN